MRTSKTRRVEGKVEEISTWHTPHRSLEDNWNRKYARISIWAHTDQGHQVWLETVRGENGSIGERCREHEARYQHLIGQNIRYRLKTDLYSGYERGFILEEGK